MLIPNFIFGIDKIKSLFFSLDKLLIYMVYFSIMITQSQVDQLTKILMDNPLVSDTRICSMISPPVSRTVVKKYREKLGCQTSVRLTMKNGKEQIYTMPGATDITDNLDVQMLKQLADLPSQDDGNEALLLIKDILKVIYANAI